MHSYDPPRAPYYPSTVSQLRPARDRESAPAASHTPIFDTLYSEYLRAFRALPGDRTGEEDLGFTAFSYGGAYGGSGTSGGSASYGTGSAGWNGSAWQQTDSWQPSYTPQPAYSYAVSATTASPSGYGNGRQHQTGMHHIPAALPPAPRRGY
ncbi:MULTISPECIES: hypothetical protein [unclassified Streptomyces]|uniref:hypothetical protein n=1 Tax=unclassified Streptomyces TaxID=2593676 RepID=UPI002250EDA6|nr:MULTISPECIES: hypothetical protein [unclassified Streptomyces]MCX4525082.1 hypothetical protein [Streptomyces sp. NBC_01551]MCX4544407.1 hypothetical protein [Streptomyces sp. NBC_01565]